MGNLPLITVVTVVYNCVKEIEGTIRSVLNQTYPHIEYIVIDGASTDGTTDVIKKYSDGITMWISEPDKGIYDAMNKAIDKASGEWVIFMNAGDYFYSNGSVSAVFTKDMDYSGIDVVYGDAEFRLKSFSYIIEALEAAPDRFMPFSHQAAFTRTSLAKQYKFDTAYKIAADTDFFLRLTRNGGVFKHVPVVVCSYDARQGVSVSNEVIKSKELVEMQLKNGAKPSAYFRKFIRNAYIKQYMRKLMPRVLWDYMHENKLKKKYVK